MDARLKQYLTLDVSIGYDASATSVVLSAGLGDRYINLVTPYYLAWWNYTTYLDNSKEDPNFEIVKVTGRTSDTLTVVRGQQGTVASTKNTATKTYKVLPLTVSSHLGVAGVTFANLPVVKAGEIATVTDSTVNTWGSIIAGGGANTVLAFFNGVNWTVTAK